MFSLSAVCGAALRAAKSKSMLRRSKQKVPAERAPKKPKKSPRVANRAAAPAARETATVALKAAETKAAKLSSQVPWWFAPLQERHLAILVDGHAMLYRCFHTYERYTAAELRTEENVKRWAKDSVNNYTSSLFRLTPPGLDPTVHYHRQLIVLLDGGAYARTDVLPTYKTNRESIRRPEIDQFISYGMSALRSMPRIDVIPRSRGDFSAEADDLIYTVVEKCKTLGNTEVIIVSHDKDLFQMIDSARGVYYYNLGAKIFYDEATVMKKLGVLPTQIRDYLALLGDPVDAIPGVPGLGKQRSAKLLRLYGDMETIFSKAKEQGSLVGIPPDVVKGILPFENRAFEMRDAVVTLRKVPVVFEQLKLQGDYVNTPTAS